MQQLGIPPAQQKVLSREQDIFQQIIAWEKQRLDKLFKLGIKPQQIIFDPGIGFGKTPQQSIVLLKNIDRLRELETPLLIGHSRKSFLKSFADFSPTELDFETALLSYYLSAHSVDYLRVHNVELNARALRLAAEMR
jgi:dihydropteroate synthase